MNSSVNPTFADDLAATPVGDVSESIHLLLVDDNPGDIVLVQELLHETAETTTFEFSTASSMADAAEALRTRAVDIVLLDLSLPDTVGTETIERMRQFCDATPVVILSGLSDDGLALRAVREGAQDYLCKNELEPNMLVRTVRHALERHRLQMELESARQAQMHAQKLESLGVLTGGIAHDFNNILGAVMGYAELTQRAKIDELKLHRYMDKIISGCRRGSELCKQMLAYAGHAEVNKTVFRLDSVMNDLAGFIRVTVNPAVDFKVEPGDPVGAIEADVFQVRQILLNFLTNASEAIDSAEGGCIRVRAGQAYLDSYRLRELHGDQARAGPFAWIEVADNGTGIDQANLERIFDPFFTTKFEGRGLGLSAVLGIINNHQGALEIDSTPGVGSRFRAYFPLSEKSATAETITDEARPTQRCCRADKPAVLIADDESGMREWLTTYFRGTGNEVVEAASGDEAIAQLRSHAGRIGTALVDVTMPGPSTERLFRSLVAIDPDVDLVVITGHSREEALARLKSFSEKRFEIVHKPFTVADISQAMGRLGKPPLPDGSG